MGVKNPQNIPVPAYLDEQFFAHALEDGLRERKVILHDLSFDWGSAPGENFCSVIYRVLVTFERSNDESSGNLEHLSLIVKSIPIAPDQQFLQDVDVFIKEKIFYYDVLPQLEILANGEKLGAKCYYAVRAPVQTIVFRDLMVDGYKMASRQDGLDWDHSVLLLKKLAKLHATSMVLAKRNPEIVPRFQKGMLCADTIIKSDTFKQLFGGSLGHMLTVIGQWPGYEHITERLQYYHQNFKEITSKLALPKSGDKFTVLNHGDMYTNNFMFVHDDASAPNKPTKVIFVDFQLSFYGSPGCDINFLLNTSVQLDLLQYKRDDLINVYYECFSETLESLRYESIPTLEDLKYEIRSRELYGLFGLFGFLPLVSMPSKHSKDNSLETFSDEEFQRKKLHLMFTNEKLLPHLRYALKRLEKLGVLNEF